MPQLPSGRHVALDPSALQTIVDGAFEGIAAHELMAIESENDLFSHIMVLYFRPKPGEGSPLPLAKGSLAPPQDLEPYQSGFNLVTIKEEWERWDDDDKRAFVRFLRDGRTGEFLENILQTVKTLQEDLLSRPTTIQGTLATWWRLGIHPLQDPIE